MELRNAQVYTVQFSLSFVAVNNDYTKAHCFLLSSLSSSSSLAWYYTHFNFH